MPLSSKLIRHFTDPVPGRAFLLSPLLVCVTTWLLFQVQLVLIRVDKVPTVRPFSIGYLIPLVLLTFLGGRAVGMFTLALSALASAYVLTEPRFSMHLDHRRDQMELLLLLIVGFVLIAVASAFHSTLREFATALSVAKLENEVRQCVTEIEEACLVHSCSVQRIGLDYYILIEAYLCREVSEAESHAIAGAVETELRRINPFIAEATVRIDARQSA